MATPVLPESLKFQPAQPSVRARVYRSACQPDSGATAVGLDVVRIPIPCNPATYLNGKQSYLTFDLKNTNSTATTFMSALGHNVIRRVEVYSGGNLLSSTDEYSLMHSMYTQSQVNSADANTIHAILNNAVDNPPSENASNAGVQIGAVIATGSSVKVAFPLIDPILGTACDSMIPLHAMSDLTLQLTLHSADTGIYNLGTDGATANATSSYQLSNIRFMAEVVELDAGANQALTQAVGGQFKVSSQGIRHYNADVPASTGAVSALISARFQSWNNFIACMRKNAFITDNSVDCQNIRARNGLTSFQLRAGAEFYPPQEVKCNAGETAECLMELQKVYHGVGSTLSHGILNKTSYEASNPACKAGASGGVIDPDNTAYMGTFMFGLDLSAYGSNSSAMLDGLNTLASQSFLELKFSGNSEAVAMRLDVFARFDQMLVCDANTGIAQVTF